MPEQQSVRKWCAEHQICPACGSTMTEIGKEVRRRIKMIPAQVVVVEDRYYTYAC